MTKRWTPRQRQTYSSLIDQSDGIERELTIEGINQYLSGSTAKKLNDFEPYVISLAWRLITEDGRASLAQMCEEIQEWREKKTSSQELSKIFRIHGIETKKANYGLTVTTTALGIEKILKRMGLDTSQLSSLLTPNLEIKGDKNEEF